METPTEIITRNAQGRLFVSIGILVLILTVANDAENAKTWAALLTPAEFFGILGHAAGALMVYLGARQQDPAAKL